MKLSLSIPTEDIAFLDEYASAHELGSRSAAVQAAIKALRVSELPGGYADAWAEWDTDGEGEAWEASVGDGLR